MEWTGGIHGNIRVLALQEGREEGREEGRLLGMRDVLLWQLKARFGELPECTLERLENATMETLKEWLQRLPWAKDLSEFS